MARSAQLILKEMQTFKRMARIVHDIYAGQLKSPRLISYMTNLSPASLKAPKGAPRQRAVWASFAKSPGSLRQVPRRLRRVSEVASWPRLGRLGRVWRRLAGVWAGVPRLGCVSRASLASRGSGFGPGVVFRGRGFGPGVVSGVFFFASRPRPASPARLGRVPGRLGRVLPRPGTRVSRVSAASARRNVA